MADWGADTRMRATTGAQGGAWARRSLFLLIGQSNMAGRAELDAETGVTRPRISRLTPRGTWEPAADPLHRESPGLPGIGPGMSFALTVALAMPDAAIGLVPCAVGGAPLARWLKGADLFDAAVDRTRGALATGGSLAAILWHQGESDALAVADAGTYEARLRETIGHLRHALGDATVPFIAGELGLFLPPAEFPGAAQVNAALRHLAGRVLRYACVSSLGLTDKGDRKHFDTASQRELGQRYAAAYLGLVAPARPGPAAMRPNGAQST